MTIFDGIWRWQFLGLGVRFWGRGDKFRERPIDQISSSNYRERFKLLYPCTRLQHSPRSFHTCTTTVETHREISWSLHFHYTTTWTRHPNWHPTTRWHLNIWHVDWVPTFYGGITVDISMGWCNMAMALQIFRFQIALSGLVLLGWWWCQEWKDDERDTPVVLGVVVVGCRNVVSGVSRRVSGVIIRHY